MMIVLCAQILEGLHPPLSPLVPAHFREPKPRFQAGVCLVGPEETCIPTTCGTAPCNVESNKTLGCPGAPGDWQAAQGGVGSTTCCKELTNKVPLLTCLLCAGLFSVGVLTPNQALPACTSPQRPQTCHLTVPRCACHARVAQGEQELGLWLKSARGAGPVPTLSVLLQAHRQNPATATRGGPWAWGRQLPKPHLGAHTGVAQLGGVAGQ